MYQLKFFDLNELFWKRKQFCLATLKSKQRKKIRTPTRRKYLLFKNT